MNHGAAVVLGLTSVPTYPLNNILLGPDGVGEHHQHVGVGQPDNGMVTHLISGSAACAANGALGCWPVAAGPSTPTRFVSSRTTIPC